MDWEVESFSILSLCTKSLVQEVGRATRPSYYIGVKVYGAASNFPLIHQHLRAIQTARVSTIQTNSVNTNPNEHNPKHQYVSNSTR